MKEQGLDLTTLLELDGIRYVIDASLGLWVKFEVKQVKVTKERPHGVKYSLTLHDRHNRRLIGFDNAHAVDVRRNEESAPFDHWHRDAEDRGWPIHFIDPATLVSDFWRAVDNFLKQNEVVVHD